MKNILIADSHNLCREALCNYIRRADRNLSVEEFFDLATLHSRVIDTKPDLVLIDYALEGLEESSFGDTKVGIIVVASDERFLLNPSLHGVFPKSLSCKAFLGGIHEILEGRTFFPLPEDDRTWISTQKPTPQNYNLTAREKEVLSFLVKGQSNKDIARALDLQVVTVKLHVRGICRKMKVSNRTQAALAAKENGWG